MTSSVTFSGTGPLYQATVNGGLGSATSVIIEGYTYIMSSAFSSKTQITSITMSNSVTSIGNAAFYGTNITSITIPNSVTDIGTSAFQNCANLTSITIPNSVTSTGFEVFQGCTKLTSVIIGNSITSITRNMFRNCVALTSITIPNSVTNIGSTAFYNCTSLNSITIPNSVTSISADAFNISGITTVYLANNKVISGITFQSPAYNVSFFGITVTIVPPGTLIFSGSGSLTQTTVNASLGSATSVVIVGYTSIDDSAFSVKTQITSITIPNSVTSIGNGAFFRCEKITSMNIPNSITSIGNYAFQRCELLGSITIPNSVTSIGIAAFDSCTSLTSITIPNSIINISNDMFINCSKLASVTIPNSVTIIGTSAFKTCSKLTSITIPNSVTSIGAMAFDLCVDLTSVVIETPSNIITVSTDSFTNVSSIIGSSITFKNTMSFSNLSATWQTISTYFASIQYDQVAPTITFPSIYATYGNSPVTVSYTSNSNGSVTFTSSDPLVATISGSIITFVGAGLALITATQIATNNYFEASTTTNLTVNKAVTTLSNFNNVNKTFGDPLFDLLAPSSNSNGLFSYTSSDPSVATVSGSTVTIVGAKTEPIVITAFQASTNNYLEASISCSLTVNKAVPVLSNFNSQTKMIYDDDFILDYPSSTSSGAFSYISSNPNVASVSGNFITINDGGNTTILAIQEATNNYESTSITCVITILKRPTILSNFSNLEKTFGNNDFALLDPTSNREGSYRYVSSNPLVAIITNNIVKIISGGSTIITAIQLESAEYAEKTINCVLTVFKINPKLININVSNENNEYQIRFQSTSDGIYSYTFSDNTAVKINTNNTLTFLKKATVIVTIYQDETSNYFKGTYSTIIDHNM